MAIDSAPDLFRATYTELTPGDTMQDEGSLASGTAITCRFGKGILDPRRNGKVFYAASVLPAGATQDYSIRFFQYDLDSETVDYVSYPEAFHTVSNKRYRAPGLAYDQFRDRLWCVYVHANNDPDDHGANASELYVNYSNDQGATWNGRTLLATAGAGNVFQKPLYSPCQVDVGADGTGMLLLPRQTTATGSNIYLHYALDSGGTTWSLTGAITAAAYTDTGTAQQTHAFALDNSGNAVAVLYSYVGGTTHTYTAWSYNGTSWSSIGTFYTNTSQLLTWVKVLYDKTNAVWYLVGAEQSGSDFRYAVVNSSLAFSVSPTTHGSIASPGGANGFDLDYSLDADGQLHIVSCVGPSTSYTDWYRIDDPTAAAWTVSASDTRAGGTGGINRTNNSAGDFGYFEDAQSPYPGTGYASYSIFGYGGNAHLLHHGVRSGTSIDSVWTIVGEGIAAEEPSVDTDTIQPGVTPPGASYLWVQSEADPADTIIASSGANPSISRFTATARLHPIYGADKFRLNRWLQMWLRYANWGESTIAVTYWTDNRKSRSRTITLNTADVPTPEGGPASGSEFLMPPGDLLVEEPVNLRMGGAKLHVELVITRGATVLRGMQTFYSPARRHAQRARTFRYTTPQGGA